MTTIIKQNDHGYDIVQHIFRSLRPLFLEGTSVRFVMGSQDYKKQYINSDAYILNSTKDEVTLEYKFKQEDTIYTGVYVGMFIVTWMDGKQKTFPSNGGIPIQIQNTLDLGKTTQFEQKQALAVSLIDKKFNELQEGVEEWKQSVAADVLEEVYDNVDVGRVSNEEVRRARGDKASLGERMDGFTAELAQTATKEKPDSVLLYNRALEEMSVPLNSLNRVKQAISEGSLRVAIIGDSTGEGSDLVNREDAYFNRFINQLKTSLPGVQIIFQNFSLSSRQVTDFTNDNFKGMATDPTDRRAGFNRVWSVLGKTWKEHIKDFAPDLLLVAFGMNDTGKTNPDQVEYDNQKLIDDYTKTFTKAPSLVLITPFLPAMSHSQSQTFTQSVARSIREYAKEKGYPLVDANRIYKILRDGIDDETRETYKEVGFEKFNTNQWSGDKEDFNLNGTNLSPVAGATNKFVINNRPFYNGSIELTFAPKADGAAGNLRVEYRRIGTNRMTVLAIPGANNGQLLLSVTTGSSITLAIKNNLTIPYTSIHKIKIVAEGTKHQVYLNGNLELEGTTYAKLHDGDIRIGSDRIVPGFASPTIHYKDEVRGDSVYSEDYLLGTIGGSQSGNGINHLTGRGYALVNLPPLSLLVDKIARSIGGGEGSDNSAETITFEPELQNGWLDHAEGDKVKVIKIGSMVYIEGLIKGGTTSNGTVIFNLPEGFRPRIRNLHNVATSTGGGSLDINNLTGSVKVGLGATSDFMSVNCFFSTQ